jgi:hypothetical protein
MKTRSCLVVLTLSLILISSLGLGSTPKAEAAVVGHFTDVEGRVDLMKGGNPPATPVKVQDPVEVGDVIRTKSLSRAQVKFVDDTVLTISPESRVGVEEYMYDGSKGQRQASLEVFRGLVHTLVTKIIKVEQPDFLIKTHTGILGIRGSDIYTQPHPTSTHYYMNSGESTVKNRWSEVKGEVHLGPRQFTVVGQGLTPTTPMHFDVEDIAHLKSRLAPQSGGKGGAGGTSSGSGGGEGGKGSGQQSSQEGKSSSGTTGTGEGSQTTSDSTGTGGGGQTVSGSTTLTTEVSGTQPTSGSTTLGAGAPTPGMGSITGDPVTGGSVGGVYIPPTTNTQSPVTSPVETPITPPPQPSTFTFTQQYNGSFTAVSTGTSTTYWGSGWGQRTGVYDGYFATNSSTLGTSGLTPSVGLNSGTVTGAMTGTVTGFSGQDLTGTMTYTGTNSYGGTVSFTTAVTIKASGELTYQYQGAQFTQTPGSYIEQTATGNFQSQAYDPRNAEAVSNTAPLAVGSTTGQSYKAAFAFTNNSPAIKTFSAADSGIVSVITTGVLVNGDMGGWGALTANFVMAGNGNVTKTLGGSLFAGPSGVLYSYLLGSESLGSNGQYVTTRGMWLQTPVDSTLVPFTQRYYGSFTQTSKFHNTEATINGSAWGDRSGVRSGYYAATLTGTNSSGGGALPAVDYRTMDLTMVGFVDTSRNAHGNQTGMVYGIGEMAPYTATFDNFSGDITIRRNGKATINFGSTWLTAGGGIENLSGTITQTPGVFFQASGTTRALFSADWWGRAQTITNIEPISGDLRIPGLNVFYMALNGDLNLTNTASKPGTFWGRQRENLTVNVQGVIVPSGGGGGHGHHGHGYGPSQNPNIGNGTLTGAMSMTTYNAAQGINSFRGPVSINLSSGRVTADIIGKNLVGPGRNIPATQRGDLHLTRRGYGGGGK